MPKSPEQKAADALEEGVKRTDWNPVTFALYVIRKDVTTQWRILEAFYQIVRAWRREQHTSPQAKPMLEWYSQDQHFTDTEKEILGEEN